MTRDYSPTLRVIMCPAVDGRSDPIGILVNPTPEEGQAAMEWLAGQVDRTFYRVDQMRAVHVPVIRDEGGRV